MASVSPPLNCKTALESIVVLVNPKASNVGNSKGGILGELIFAGASKGALIWESFPSNWPPAGTSALTVF